MKITKKAQSSNMIWDAKNNRPLCVFDDSGVLESDDKGVIDILIKLGHLAEEEPKAPKGKG